MITIGKIQQAMTLHQLSMFDVELGLSHPNETFGETAARLRREIDDEPYEMNQATLEECADLYGAMEKRWMELLN